MADPMQIVFLMTDTQRPDMLGCYGHEAMRTPHLDRLAAQGVRFNHAYCCQPVCGPARVGLFTGLWPHSAGGWGNLQAIGDNVKTIGQRFRDQGFQTGYMGKWHLDGSDYFGLGRCPDGWNADYWYDMRNYLEELSPEDRVRSRRTATNQDPDLTAEFCYGHRVSNRAIRFLEEYTDSSFLLCVSYDEPHGPFLCPEPYASMYRGYDYPPSPNLADTLEDKPELQRIWAGQRLGQDPPARRRFPAFLGCNSFVDAEIGRVLAAIDQFAPNALVVYTADHGDALGAHRLNGKGPAMYDEIARVPFMVRWPGHVPPTEVCDQPISHIDLVPTLMEAAGLAVPRSLEGRSMLGTWQDPRQATRDTVFIEFGRYEVDHDGFGGLQLVRCAFDGRYKLSVNLLDTDELYDLGTDPHEMVNLIKSADHADQRDRLHDALLDWMNDTRDPFRGYQWQRRPWRIDAPRPTWAVDGWTRQRENEEYEPRQLDYDTGMPMVEAARRK